MSLLFRMIYVYLLSLFRERLPIGKTESRLRLLTLPNDLDINMHMNNGRYLTICDLNRVDLFIRTGLAKVMVKKGWMPIIADHTMTYKKPLKLFERFHVSLTLTHWDEKFFYMTHTFMAGDRLVAVGTSKGVVRGKGGVVAPGEVLAEVERSRGGVVAGV
ncbi:acyl-CoA thioesterase [Noviherbaspirillum galbum]|uniref:Thioesterase n=1 Tax=Noviherbaspirillum galbum TaxID=2709383 RepID=A0A6B3SK23_9BURK|nr:acyl-CoA thioesterase [Noviherbaspirillum galbum]NEX61204.1 thioesterase [Noviherbaspirillum galbum]